MWLVVKCSIFVFRLTYQFFDLIAQSYTNKVKRKKNHDPAIFLKSG